MRQYKKKQLLNALKQLYGVHQYAKELASAKKGKNPKQCAEEQEALGECQNVAIAVGNNIEESEGEGTKTVRLLEEYCELLYRIASGEGMVLVADAKQNYIQLDEKLQQTERCLEKEIKEEIVAVFLPYKASMWDALESVWQAAEEDENCTAYVVPIPYYDKNKDGSLGKEHYEGGQYPSYVTITSYKDLSLEELHPDLIFIHNPYDQFNKVTSVEPAFYASQLKKYTDRLVYIPYFVTGEDVPRHFCVLPGTLFADYVMVENEEVRAIYIEEYEAMTGRKDGEAKFLALGSPKYDKVEALKREMAEIPAEWQEKIAGKKVIFYNTTVHTLLNEPEKAIRKIRQVIQTFKEHKEAVLLWRPHPLSLATLKAEKPELAEVYEQLVEEYKKSGSGIYDDTPDMERTFAISDAYYGDFGSVPTLYKHTGKPMMFQSLDIEEEGKSGEGERKLPGHVDCYAGLIEGAKMYIPSIEYALLLEYDLVSWERRCLLDFMEVFEKNPIRAMAVFKEGELIYLVLRNTFRILACDLSTRQITFIGEQPIYEDSEEHIGNAFRIGDEIWIIPSSIRNNVQIFDIKRSTFTELSTAVKLDGQEEALWFTEGAICGDAIYLPVLTSNVICELHCKEKTMKIWTLEEGIAIHALSSYEGEIWFLDLQNPAFPKLCQWEGERGIVETIELGRFDWDENCNLHGWSLFREVIVYQEKLIVIPRRTHEIIVIDRRKRIERRLSYPEKFRRDENAVGKEMFRGISREGKRVFLYPCACNGVLILNMETEEFEFQELRLSEKDCKTDYDIFYRERQGVKDPSFVEGEYIYRMRGRFFLADYIREIEVDGKSVQTGKESGNGNRIYDYVADRKERRAIYQ